MQRKQAILYVVIAAIPVIFFLVLLAIFSLPLMLLAVMALIFVIGSLKTRRPEFFDALRKKETLPPLEPRPTDPPTHISPPKTYMTLVSLNSSNRYRVTVDNSSFLIGRSESCNFTLDDPLVSRRHLCIEYDEDDKTCYAIDRSANGTFLNSERLQKNQRYPLKPGDSLQIANTVFSVEYAYY